MRAADFFAIIDDAAHTADALDPAGEAVLAAKVPALCQTCDGSGRVTFTAHTCTDENCKEGVCPDCPTIDVLLAEATGVRRLAQEFGVTTSALLSLGYLSLLRAVQP